MGDAPRSSAPSLREARDQAVAVLSQRYAESIIDEDELERRLERVEQADSVPAVDTITRDLTTNSSTAVAIATMPALARIEDIHPTRDFVSVFGESKQLAAWSPARVNRVLTVFGSSTLDFRHASLGAGVTEIRLRTVLAEVELIVPPGLPVEVDCALILAGVERDNPNPVQPPVAGAPQLRLTGFATLAGITISERLAGESKRDAKRRRKAERRRERSRP
ncbi:MAG: hypothetical protein B7733_26090 [Myxococcales bacterium FL481]|nr:MAG: hypothetical protein B7733_26090 [Myxococcales bacterium FL481]